MITFGCQQCGKKLGVKDENFGRKVRCPQCGCVNVAGIETLEAQPAPEPSSEQSVAESACTCGTCGGSFDVQQVYDGGGDTYICHACWEAQEASQPAEAPALPQPVLRYPCSSCGGVFVPDSLYEQDGAYVCHGCWQAQAAGAAATRPKTVRRYPCSSCFGTFVAKSLYNQDGSYICHNCYAAARTASLRLRDQARAKRSRSRWIIGISATALAAAVTIFAVLQHQANVREFNEHMQEVSPRPTTSFNSFFARA